MKIYVINLKRAADRRAHMEKKLQALGLEAEFFEAYDGRNLTDDEPLFDKELSLERNGQALTKGELGCSMSHRALYERIVKDNIDRALILEDDITLDPRIVSLLSDERFLTSVHWDWLQIDYNKVGWWYVTDSFRSARVQIQRRPSFIFYFVAKIPFIFFIAAFEKLRDEYYRATKPAIVPFFRPLYLASAYVVTRHAAEVLLKLQTPVVYAADRLPNEARKQKGLVMRAVSPLMSYQDKQYTSDIAALYNA